MPSCLRVGEVVSGQYGDIYYADNNRVSTGVHALLLLPDTATADLSQCAAVSISGAEYLALKAGSGNSGTVQTLTPQNWLELGNMSMADAQLISGYIALLWAGMWGAKQIIRALFINERNQDE